MATRLELHEVLCELLGSRNVYYQPPESVKMEYPAIVYSRNNIKSTFANDAAYSFSRSYEVIVIDRRPDNPVVDKILALPYSSFNRNYTSDGLVHDALTLYF